MADRFAVWSLPIQRALHLCERAYAADPLHVGAKRRLSGWAPTKWKERIAKEVRWRSRNDRYVRLPASRGTKCASGCFERGTVLLHYEYWILFLLLVYAHLSE